MIRGLGGVVIMGLVALAIAGCGGGSGSAGSSSTVQTLSYFPASSPLVMTIATNPQSQAVKQLQTLERQFPAYAAGATALFAQMSRQGIDYNKDVRPLFGNPITLGAVSTSGFGGSGSPPFLIAWVTKNASRLSALIGKIHGLRSAGSHDGAKLYAHGGTVAAVDGATVLLSGSTKVLDTALDRHAHGGGLTAADYARDTTGIAADGLVTMFGDLTGALSGNKQADRVPWVAAIHGYGVSISAGQRALSLRYHIDTTGKSLSVAQLPIATGSASPGLAGNLPIQAGLRDPAQTIDFILAAIRATNPNEYAKLIADEAALKAATGIDVNSQIAALSGSLNVESDGHITIARAQVANPASMQAMLAKLAQPGAATATGLRAIGGGFYSIHSGSRLTIGVVDNQLLVGDAMPAQLTAFAGAPRSTTSTGAGAVAFRVALSQLAGLALGGTPNPVEQQVLKLLGDVTGSAQATTGGLSGTATLALH